MNIGKTIDLSKKENLILFNTIYHRTTDETNKHDAISLVFKDMDTGGKILKILDDPKMEVYKAKAHVDLGDINHVIIERDKVDKFDVRHKQKTLDIAKLLGKDAEDFYWNCLKTKNFKETKQITMDNRLFSCDRNIEDFYRYKCLNHFGQKELTKPSKGFFDIEADIAYGEIDFKTNTGEAPVNAVTLVDAESMISYTILLRDDNNPLIAEFEKDIPRFLASMNEKHDDEYGKFEYKIAMFDYELDLIKFLFKLINTLNLDFLLAWNMGFDIPYLIHRIKVNGGSPKEIICHPDFNYKECKYDSKEEYDIKKKTDWFNVSAYTVYMDQMINYAAIRKSQSKLDSYKLNFIGEREVNAKKLDYSDLGHIREFPYKDYARYVEYNIIDCMVQYKIEEKVNDIDTILYRSYEGNTRFNKVFKEVTFLTNVAYKDFKDFQGYVLGNNINGMLYDANDKDREKFSGAFVGNPMLVAEVGKRLFSSAYSKNIFDSIVDYDYTSLYPTIIMMFNIFKTTLLGKIIIKGAESDLEMLSKSALPDEMKYDRGAQYMEDLETNEPLYFCNKWLGLPNIEDTMALVEHSLGIDECRTRIRIKRTNGVKKKKTIKVRRKQVA